MQNDIRKCKTTSKPGFSGLRTEKISRFRFGTHQHEVGGFVWQPKMTVGSPKLCASCSCRPSWLYKPPSYLLRATKVHPSSRWANKYPLCTQGFFSPCSHCQILNIIGDMHMYVKRRYFWYLVWSIWSMSTYLARRYFPNSQPAKVRNFQKKTTKKNEFDP